MDERPRGGRNHIKVDEEMRRCLEAILNKNRMLTLTAINVELQRRLPEKLFVSDRTMSTHLEGVLFTRTLAHRVPAERNRQDVIERRHEYAHWLFLEEANLYNSVFIDECTTYGQREVTGARFAGIGPTVRYVVKKEEI